MKVVDMFRRRSVAELNKGGGYQMEEITVLSSAFSACDLRDLSATHTHTHTHRPSDGPPRSSATAATLKVLRALHFPAWQMKALA